MKKCNGIGTEDYLPGAVSGAAGCFGLTNPNGNLVNANKKGRLRAPFLVSACVYFPAVASRLLWRAAAFLWIRPLREARSSSFTAASFSSAFPADARLRAVRSADFWE